MLSKEDLFLLRTYLGLRLSDVADSMSCTLQTISHIENGRAKHSANQLLYQEALLNILSNRLDGPTTYEGYCKLQIKEWKQRLSRGV